MLARFRKINLIGQVEEYFPSISHIRTVSKQSKFVNGLQHTPTIRMELHKAVLSLNLKDYK